MLFEVTDELYQAGCFFGALFAFPLAEKLGRKKTMIIASSVFLLGGTLMTAAMGNLNMIYGGRAIAGLGIGASSMTVPVYIAEIAPPSVRGRLIGIFEIASQGGGMLGFWINYACDRTIDVERKAQWIVPLAVQLIPGLLLLLGVAWCPESPRKSHIGVDGGDTDLTQVGWPVETILRVPRRF